MRTIAILTLAATVLAGCAGTGGPNHVAFDGVHYRGTLKADRDDRHNFVASVRPVSAGLEGAREAGRFEGTKHCIRFYGVSDIDWQVGPETETEDLQIDDDTLVFRGRCVE